MSYSKNAKVAALRRLRNDEPTIPDGNRYVFRYSARVIEAMAPGTYGIFTDTEGEPQIIIRCPKCGQVSALQHDIDVDGRIQQETVCPAIGCDWIAFAMLAAWRETWRRIVDEYPDSRAVVAARGRLQSTA